MRRRRLLICNGCRRLLGSDSSNSDIRFVKELTYLTHGSSVRKGMLETLVCESHALKRG